MTLKMAMVFAKDVARMTAFYRDGLGLAVVPAESSEGWVVFDAGGARFALHAIPPAIASGIAIADPPLAREDTPIKLVFGVAELAAASDRVAKAGGTLLPARNPRSRDALDPEGNVIQLWTG
jgi:predicted enzyme related to lactoylglutathione lyase